MAIVQDDRVITDRRWEAEQLAREAQSRRYEQEGDEREQRGKGDDDNSPRYQFMVYTRYHRSEGSDKQEL